MMNLKIFLILILALISQESRTCPDLFLPYNGAENEYLQGILDKNRFSNYQELYLHYYNQLKEVNGEKFSFQSVVIAFSEISDETMSEIFRVFNYFKDEPEGPKNLLTLMRKYDGFIGPIDDKKRIALANRWRNHFGIHLALTAFKNKKYLEVNFSRFFGSPEELTKEKYLLFFNQFQSLNFDDKVKFLSLLRDGTLVDRSQEVGVTFSSNEYPFRMQELLSTLIFSFNWSIEKIFERAADLDNFWAMIESFSDPRYDQQKNLLKIPVTNRDKLKWKISRFTSASYFTFYSNNRMNTEKIQNLFARYFSAPYDKLYNKILSMLDASVSTGIPLNVEEIDKIN
ncbi:MAG: hypothetical protein QE271_14235 [Bacteriovoracaceae bacterium]|nr:hypothetical protein [Bacteriovoracaceae bacterium]